MQIENNATIVVRLESQMTRHGGLCDNVRLIVTQCWPLVWFRVEKNIQVVWHMNIVRLNKRDERTSSGMHAVGN